MQNVMLVAALLLTAKPAPAAGPYRAAPAPGVVAEAPADTYFGPFGMSPLSIRSRIGSLGRQYHARTISDHDLLRDALMAEDALRKWRAQYPADPWLAPTFFHLEQLYGAVQTDEARKHASEMLRDTVRYFPDTKYGHLSRARLRAGFPPLVAESPLVAPPGAAVPTASPAMEISNGASPAPHP